MSDRYAFLSRSVIACSLAALGLTGLGGCSKDTSPNTTHPGTGGSVSSQAGSSSSSSSATSSGGTKQTGGTTSAGGSSSASSASGGTASGGTSAAGGSSATGGSRATGGTTAGGGSSPTGGSSAAGGVTASGGTLATGGTGTGGARTGGTSGRGGATGGAGGAGGTSAGGTTGGGGTAAAGSTGSKVVGATPPMGWNSWNTFNCSPSESLIKGIADVMVSSGMATAGYEYVNIDDCWMSGRDGSGNLVADSSKFPSGMASLATYVHGKGLKLGIYETPSDTTCAGKTGGAGHESQDAKTFASWGIDYLKYDHCRTTDMGSFARMGTALKATNRDIFYSINPVYGSGSCVPPNCTVDELKVCNMWRIGFDINASWGSFTGLIDTDKPLAQYAGPGHWNDPDMLEVGKGMSQDEDRSHFGMWAILAAPLLTGNDLRSMNATTKAILTNKDVIDVDQDSLGAQGTMVAGTAKAAEVWSKKLSGTNARAVALFNRTGSATAMTVQWSQIGLPAGAATVRDLWNQKDLGSFTDSYAATSVPSHGIVMLKIVSGP
ncbi:MAG TPA: glycoside hydrolase family 27 protein [Polyangia bacterium]